jgi:hypothetical protein
MYASDISATLSDGTSLQLVRDAASMNKQHILDEIKRTARENGGKAVGSGRFEKLTGIKVGDWSGRYWARWGDAVSEAGLAPNQLTGALDSNAILALYVALARQQGRLPVNAEMKLHKLRNPEFPNHKVFERFGSKQHLIRKVLAYCTENPGNEDVAAMCAPHVKIATPEPKQSDSDEFETGYVYLALM